MSKRNWVVMMAIVAVGATLSLWTATLHAAVQAAAPAIPPAPAPSGQEVAPSLMWVLVVVPVLNWARQNPKVTWIKDQTVFWASGAAAVAGQVGIHWAYNHDTGTLVITGLTAQAAGIVTKWCSQHLLYRHLKAIDAIAKVADAIGKDAAATKV